MFVHCSDFFRVYGVAFNAGFFSCYVCFFFFSLSCACHFFVVPVSYVISVGRVSYFVHDCFMSWRFSMYEALMLMHASLSPFSRIVTVRDG